MDEQQAEEYATKLATSLKELHEGQIAIIAAIQDMDGRLNKLREIVEQQDRNAAELERRTVHFNTQVERFDKSMHAFRDEVLQQSATLRNHAEVLKDLTGAKPARPQGPVSLH